MNKVALVAIAKDEAAYLHEWVHHHLYLGFSPIIIGINRTSDTSSDILTKITNENKDVHFEVLDWIDKVDPAVSKSIQPLSYSYLSNKLNLDDSDYVCFLDIDEFWFSFEGDKVDKFIHDNKGFDIASFHWICQGGEEAKFLPPFKDVKTTRIDMVKSMVSVSSLNKAVKIGAHIPFYEFSDYINITHIDNNGNRISCDEVNGFNSKTPSSRSLSSNYGILHRMSRSEEEYMSIILRGRLAGQIIKDNARDGFIIHKERLLNPFNENYYKSLSNFIEKNNIVNDVENARVNVLGFYKEKINKMTQSQLISEYRRANKALNGTSGLLLFINCFLNKVKRPESLRDFAILLEKSDVSSSYKLMEAAHEIKPTGPVIKKKLKEYKELLNL